MLLAGRALRSSRAVGTARKAAASCLFVPSATWRFLWRILLRHASQHRACPQGCSPFRFLCPTAAEARLLCLSPVACPCAWQVGAHINRCDHHWQAASCLCFRHSPEPSLRSRLAQLFVSHSGPFPADCRCRLGKCGAGVRTPRRRRRMSATLTAMEQSAPSTSLELDILYLSKRWEAKRTLLDGNTPGNALCKGGAALVPAA